MLQAHFRALDDVVLIDLVQLDEVAAPAPDAHDEVAVILRVLLRVKEPVAVDGVDLHLVSTHVHEALDEHGAFADGVLIAEHGVGQLDGQRAAVCHARQMRLGKGLDDGDFDYF